MPFNYDLLRSTLFAGCGKSAIIRHLALALDQGLQACYLTTEVDASALVGQQMPNDEGGDSRIVWQDGAATRAYKQGSWLLVDNLDQADPCVLERMNPLLEQPSTWVLTEQGHTAPLACRMGPDGLTSGPAKGFGIFATMNSEVRPCPLSPALTNRFTVYNMQDLPREKKAFDVEVSILAAGLMGLDEFGAKNDMVVDLCWRLAEDKVCTSSGQLIRLLDRAFLLASKETMDLPVSLARAAFVVFGKMGRLADSAAGYFGQALNLPVDKLAIPSPLVIAEQAGNAKSQHVLTSSRRELASMVMMCIDCNMPLLLEVCNFLLGPSSPPPS